MSELRSVLTSLDPLALQESFDGAFDKCTSFEEAGVMVDHLADDFPALAALLDRLRQRVGEEVEDDASRTRVVLGGTLVLLGLVEHVQVRELAERFPDTSEG